VFNNTPFGFSNNSNPFGGFPVSGFNGWCGDNCSPFNCSPVSGWNNSFGGFGGGMNGFNSFNGFGGFGFPGVQGFNGYNNVNSCSPFGFNNWNSMPFGGFGVNNWNGFGVNSPVNHPISGVNSFAGINSGVGFPGMNWNSGWNGSNSPWMNWGACFPGSPVNSFIGGSPISGVSNWFNSPWMGYAYPGFSQNQNVAGKGSFVSPVNGQYVPSSAFPFPCAPYNVPFQSNGCVPSSNGFVPAGPGVNCEAA